ncbi:SaV-like [uncultured Caudovirales phage]|uniref:SaV-like n=1 Tax=uncultured Caudovirales phage TaxID=2100421 RepID=A0A6J5LXV8_9CAUD|nr:SaV-like [uncultured Caudovirales phage]
MSKKCWIRSVGGIYKFSGREYGVSDGSVIDDSGSVISLRHLLDCPESYVVKRVDSAHVPLVETNLNPIPGTVAQPDMVNNPKHYGQGKIECIDYIEDFLNKEEYIGYLRGNIAKYLHRWRYKNGIEDLKKAQWYQDRLVKFMTQ